MPEVDVMAEQLSTQTIEPPDRDYIQSLAKGLAVIEAFGAHRPTLTLSEAARLTGLSRAAARRVLITLERLGYCESDGRLFQLRPKVLNLGFAYLHGSGLSALAQPLMIELVNEVKESCSVAVLDGSDIVYVARVPTQHRIMTINLTLGSRLPAHLTSMGRVLLADLPADQLETLLTNITPIERRTGYTMTEPQRLREEIQRVGQQGYAILDQELEPGLRSVAAPIRDASGRVIAGINIGVQASRYSLAQMQSKLLPSLQQCANEISRALGATQ